MSFNFVRGKVGYPVDREAIMSGTFIGDIDGDGGDLVRVSHIQQTNAAADRIVFFKDTLTGLPGNERNIRGSDKFLFDPGSNVFTANSGMVHARNAISTHHTITTGEYFIGCNHTASITITLPFSSACSSGQTFSIKDESGRASDFNILVQVQGSDTIDGQTNFIIESAYGAVNLYSNGSNKFFLF